MRSHLGILTREYNIPCVMNAKVAGIKDGDRLMVESSAAAKTTEDYQRGVERVARIWLLGAAGERCMNDRDIVSTVSPSSVTLPHR